MKRGHIAAAGRVFVLLTACALTAGSRSHAQIPGIPGGTPSIPGAGSLVPSAVPALPSAVPALPGAATAIPGAAAVPTALPAQPATLWSFFGLSKANLAGCKAKFCQSQIGSLVNNGMLPLTAISGGLIGGCCPTTPTADQLAAAAAAGGPQGVAAQIKAEEAQAKAKIAAIEYLATVDCRYWPEAEGVLVQRLRADRTECVRYAAARALGTGCCCTKKTIAALKLVVECTDSDGNPAERSERVKSASWYALSHCVTRYVPPPPEPRERPSEPSRREYPAGYFPNARAASYAEELENTPDSVVIADARRVIDAERSAPLGDRTLPTGSRSVFNAMVKAAGTPHQHEPATSAPAADAQAVVIRSTAPPFFPAPPPPLVRPAAAVDRSVRRTSVETPTPPAHRSPRSVLDLFSASRRSRPGA